MSSVDVLNINGEKISEIQLDDKIFNIPLKEDVIHDVVVMQLANKRDGNACTKRRSEVSGSTRKLYRQKGTGRARRGDIKSPLLRGGGSIFGPKPRSYAYRLPKKVMRLALKMVLSGKYRDNELIILDQLELNEIKSKKFIEVANALKVSNALFVIDKENRNVELSARNFKNIRILRSEGLNVLDILKFKNLVLLSESIKHIERRLLA